MANIKNILRLLKIRVKRFIVDRRGYGIRGVSKPIVDFTADRQSVRINLVLLNLRSSDVYGGMATAIRFFHAIRPNFPRARLVILNESDRDFEPAAWLGWTLDSENKDGAQTIAFIAEPKSPLNVGSNDYFIATHWITANYVIALIKLQAMAFKKKLYRFVYLIQDFEPGFYPWSTNYLLADGTYRETENTIAVFNTKLLADYFVASQYKFSGTHYFEPKLNSSLAAHATALPHHPKKRLLILYGRPAQNRNAFELVAETMKFWAENYSGAEKWSVISLGVQHRDIRLSETAVMISKGKVSLETYATYLLDASVGLSLMVSPHPSYPPLEMAEFGVRVVTNNFAEKDLSTRSPFITGVKVATPENLALALIKNCELFETGNAELGKMPPRAFLGNETEFQFIEEITAQVLK